MRQYDNAFLANAYFDVGTYYGFTPYLGGGLGLNMDTLSGSTNYTETANGQTYAANLTPGASPPVWVNAQGQTLAPQPNIAFGQQFWNRSIRSTTWSMAWALAAGVGFKLTPSTTLDVGYRYLNSGDGQHARQSPDRGDDPSDQRVAPVPRRHSLSPFNRPAGRAAASVLPRARPRKTGDVLSRRLPMSVFPG